MIWTDQRIEQLRKFWLQGLSASQIAKALGDISRNAVIGKAHRLGLVSRPSPIKRTQSTATQSPRPRSASRRNVASRPAAPGKQDNLIASIPAEAPASAQPQPEIQAQQAETPRAPALTAKAHGGTKTCSWPVGDPKQPGFQFCGETSEPGRPYCEKHCAVAYQRKSEAA